MTHLDCRIPRLRKRIGRCYELSYLGAELALCSGSEWVIVHGEVNGPLHIGRIGHAWLELDDTVYDPTSDDQYVKVDFYLMLRAKVFQRYEFYEAEEKAGETAHFGPWHSVVAGA